MSKRSIIVKTLLNAFCCLLLLLGSSAHEAKALTRSEYGQLFLATFSYMTVIKACNLSSLYQASDDALVSVIRYGYKNGLHNAETERVSQNVSLYTTHGIEEFKKTGKVTCSDAAKTMCTIIDSVKQLK